MKRIGMKLLLTIVALCMFAGSAFAAPQSSTTDVPTIYLIGDSTVCKYGDDTAKYSITRSGWGENLDKYFDMSKVKIDDIALSGRSSRSFAYEKNYQKLKANLKKGDYVFIQFGHNDGSPDVPTATKFDKLYRHASPIGDETVKGTYQYYLYENFIKLAREKGATPVLVTPIVRRVFENGKVVEGHFSRDKAEAGVSYDDSMRTLAKKQHVTLIELNLATVKLYNQVGEKKAADFHAFFNEKHGNKVDNTHLNKTGSLKIAGLVAQEISKSDLPIKKFLKK